VIHFPYSSILNTVKVVKILLFWEIFIKTKKPFSKRPKGWELVSSPDCNIDRTFVSKFYFQTAVEKPSSPVKTYRNPIYLAKEYKKMINLGEVKNQAELVRTKGISRARVTQILNLLKLDKSIIDNLEQIGDPMDRKVISERELRKIIHQK